MEVLKTEKCIICGKTAVVWHGHVIGKERRALCYVDVHVIAGFCEEHMDYFNSDENGNYGEYDSEKHGVCIPLFARRKTV